MQQPNLYCVSYLNSCQESTNAPIRLGFMLKNNDTSTESIHYTYLCKDTLERHNVLSKIIQWTGGNQSISVKILSHFFQWSSILHFYLPQQRITLQAWNLLLKVILMFYIIQLPRFSSVCMFTFCQLCGQTIMFHN